MRKMIFASVAVLSLAIQVQAADLPVVPYYKAAAASAWSWSGMYMGVVAGVAMTKDALEFPGVAAIPGGIQANGWLAGGSLTARWQMPATHFVFGVEGIGAWSNIRGANDWCLLNGCDVKSSFFGAALGQAGFSLGGLPTDPNMVGQASLGNVLIYASGGAVWRRTGFSTVMGSETWTKTGYGLGGGFDVAFTRNLVLGVQYLHSFYKHETCAGCVAGLVPTDAKFSDDLVMVSLKLKLGQ